MVSPRLSSWDAFSKSIQQLLLWKSSPPISNSCLDSLRGKLDTFTLLKCLFSLTSHLENDPVLFFSLQPSGHSFWSFSAGVLLLHFKRGCPWACLSCPMMLPREALQGGGLAFYCQGLWQRHQSTNWNLLVPTGWCPSYFCMRFWVLSLEKGS